MSTKNLLDFPITTETLSSSWLHISEGGEDKKISVADFISSVNGGNPFNITVREESGNNIILTLADKNAYIRCLNAVQTTVQVKNAATVGWQIGDSIIFRKEGLGNVLFAPDSGVTLRGAASGLSLTEVGQAGQLICVDNTPTATVFDFVTGGNARATVTGSITFLTVAALGTGATNDGYTVDPAQLAANNTLVRTIWNNTTSKFGGAPYVIWTLAAYRTHIGNPSWVPDGYGDHYFVNMDHVAILQNADNVVKAECFGLVRNNTSIDSTAVLNAFFTYTRRQVYSFAPGGTTGYVFMRATLNADIPVGVYAISGTVLASNEDGDINFNNSVFVPHASYSNVNWAMQFTAWTTNIEKIRFRGWQPTDKVCRVFNNNADSGIITISRSNFGGSGLYEIDCRSSIVNMINCRIDRVTRIDITNCDKYVLDKCWINAPLYATAESCLFQLGTNAPYIEFVNCVNVPRTQSAANCALVGISKASTLNANGAQVKFIEMLSGNEPQATALVNNYASSGSATSRGTRIYFHGGTYGTSSGGAGVPAVRLFALPANISFIDVDGYAEDTHTASLVYFDETHQTFAAAQAFITSNSFVQPKIHIEGSVQNNFPGFSRQELNLMQYMRSHQKPLFGAVTCVGGVATAIPFPNQTACARYMAFRMIIINKSNGASNQVSEYIIAGNFTGAMTVTPIIAGSDAVAPRLSVSGTELRIAGNGTIFDQKYNYQVQQIGDWQSRFY